MKNMIQLMARDLEMDEIPVASQNPGRPMILNPALGHLDRSDGEDTASDFTSDGSDTEMQPSSDDLEHTVSPPSSTINFFEGAEKRLALYVVPPSTIAGLDFGERAETARAIIGKCRSAEIKLDSLRRIPIPLWEKILDVVNCRILNITSNQYMDAYLLSESSMFVADDYLIIKTCGSTTLLHCLKPMLEMIFDFGFEMVEDVFFSHKNMLAPKLQPQPHDSFSKERNCLESFFTGQSYMFGSVNSDRWYFYTADGSADALFHVGGRDKVFNLNEHFKFEMIMEELDSKAMGLYYRNSPGQTAAEVTRKSGIQGLVPGMVIDDYLFTPCGYSMNGLLGKYYMTIHITPEKEFSYVSLETNLPQKSYSTFIAKLVDIFKPGKFMINLFVPNPEVLNELAKEAMVNGASLESNAATGMQLYEELMGCPINNPKPGFRYCGIDLQMTPYKDLDVIYIRYASEGIS